MTATVNFTPSGKPIEHGGTGSAYGNYGCRCDACTKANAERCGRRRLQRLSEPPPPDSHGKVSTYNNWGCRCDECRAALAAYRRIRTARP